MVDLLGVLIIGIGALGRRHLEACLQLPHQRYALSVVEPSEENWAPADSDAGAAAITVERFRSIAELPKAHYDVAVIATRADVRLTVLRQLLDHVTPGALVLEKILFQKLDEYGPAADLIKAKGVPTWVNCPRRLWPGYLALKERYEDKFVGFSQTGYGWNIGCNGIHYLDIFDFLCGADGLRIESFTLPIAPEPDKRPGMQHVYGQCAGVLTTRGGELPFSMEEIKGDGPNAISLHLQDGVRIDITEDNAERKMIVTHIDADGVDTTESFPILFQSALTNRVVEQVIEHGYTGLTRYDESRIQHEAFLSSLHDSLLPFLPDLPPGYCPVT